RQKMLIYYPENSVVSPRNGADVVLTIDSRYQRILEEELARGHEKYKTESGLGIIMDCNTGAVLAMASVPTYDPSRYHEYPVEERALRRANRPIESTFEPGSVLKPITAAWALQHGVVSRKEVVWGGGKVHRFEGRRRVTDVRDNGPLTMEKAVFKSSNIGMAVMGRRLGKQRLMNMVDAFGFARPTGIELPGEAPGWRQTDARWSELYTSISVSFGYEIRISPIQLCAAFSAVINGGTLYRPRIVEKTVRGDAEQLNPVEVVGHPLRPEISQEMREILLRVVEDDGTGKYLRMDGFRFGGKSGTSDIGKRYTKKDYLASFEAFAPYEDPQIVVLVQMQKPRSKRYYGSWVAGPIVVQVLRRIFRVEDQPLLVKRGYDEA
ncbi:MAG: penicillin-binding protein 2, partial [Planctomycetota bacterium]